ncbi:MAG: metal-dependent hydrolase [Nitrospirota bacterium]
MDPVTHALSGVVIHRLGFARKTALFVLVFSAIAPDLDYVTRLWGADVFLRYHRGITHGILALAVFPLIMALLFGLKRKGFFYFYALSFLGYGSHLLLDLTNQYGTRILSPLDWDKYALDLTFIIDPYVSLGLLLAVVGSSVSRKRAGLIAFAAVLLLSGYIAGKAYLQEEAKQFLKTRVDAHTYRLCPLPNDFLRWWFVTSSGDDVSTGFVDLFTRRVYLQEKYRMDNGAPEIVASKQSGMVRSFLTFSRYPYAEVKNEQGRTVVLWRELSYSFLPGERFIARVVMDKQGRIIGSSFHF